MKQINTYINEKLQLTSTQKYTCQPQTTKYSCQPKDTDELRKIINERIKNEGPKCDLNDIDTSKITNMSFLFDAVHYKKLKNFNGDISLWDVSNVIDMCHMFSGCKKFDCDLSRWNVSNVKNMEYMFHECENFNSDLSRWDVSKVNNMFSIFWGCKTFDCDLSRWNVSNVKYMHSAFYDCPTQPDWYDKKRW